MVWCTGSSSCENESASLTRAQPHTLTSTPVIISDIELSAIVLTSRGLRISRAISRTGYECLRCTMRARACGSTAYTQRTRCRIPNNVTVYCAIEEHRAAACNMPGPCQRMLSNAKHNHCAFRPRACKRTAGRMTVTQQRPVTTTGERVPLSPAN